MEDLIVNMGHRLVNLIVFSSVLVILVNIVTFLGLVKIITLVDKPK